MSLAKIVGVAALVLAMAGGALWLGARPIEESLTRPDVPANAPETAIGAAAFLGGAFGGISMDALETNAVPWRIVAAALVLEETQRDASAKIDTTTLERAMSRFGFLPGAHALNLPSGLDAPPTELPFGMTYADIAPFGGAKVRVANLGCAACHGGVTYDANGSPQPDAVMLGMPNTSINLEAYTMAVFAALRRYADDPKLSEAASQLFPDMDWRERLTMRFLVLPLARQRLASLEGVNRPLPFPNGAPGSTNGVAALKLALGAPLAGGGLADSGVVSIPDLSYRTWRTDLLADGVYALPSVTTSATTADPDAERLRRLAEIVTFFTVPSMGVHPDKARHGIGDAAAIMAFLQSYQPQRFPGQIETARATRGQTIYASACASCHGTYSDETSNPKLTRFPNWQGDVGTDRLRADMFDAALAAAVGSSPYHDAIAVQPGRGYVAPPLGGLWASAPYLHNGSVPTLSALLSPDERPRRFSVGGHALDFDRVGVLLGQDGSYPDGYKPFSTPAWIDTHAPGYQASGHRFGEELSADQKLDLIEYLKRL